jgi:hypothetical protein
MGSLPCVAYSYSHFCTACTFVAFNFFGVWGDRGVWHAIKGFADVSIQVGMSFTLQIASLKQVFYQAIFQ